MALLDIVSDQGVVHQDRGTKLPPVGLGSAESALLLARGDSGSVLDVVAADAALPLARGNSGSVLGMVSDGVVTLTTALAITGKFKVWDGAEWVSKGAKVWSGSAWVEKPVKVWTGAAWVESS